MALRLAKFVILLLAGLSVGTRLSAAEPKAEDFLAYYDSALKKMEQGDLQGALVDSNKVIELQPESIKGYWSRAEVFQRTGDLDGAMADYTKILGMNFDGMEDFRCRAYRRIADCNH